MEPYGRSREPAEGSPPEPAPDWNSPTPETGLEESMWQLGLGGGRGRGGDVSYPERPGEPDCIYYLRTGFCGYGTGCRFNHPRDRTAIAGVVGSGGGVYPVRIGQPVCQYFLKTGTCKYGATCKYHHPRHEASAVSLNYHGYPLRPGEKECSYYVKTGHCKFGVTCKFHHPQPAGISLSQSAPTFYPAVQSHAIPSPSQYGVASWQVARPPPVPASYVQGPYGPMLLTQAVVPLSGWSPYSPPVSPIVHPGTPQTVGTGRTYGPTPQLSPSAPAYEGPYSSFSSIAGPSSSPKEQMFPQRPGQPECQFYMRTGDCKYGSSCRYHHPPEWSMPKSNCVLSPMGLPLRPGAPLCSFYAQNGVCKFGPTCKFDHPMGTLSYSPSASSLADMPVSPYPIGLSLGTLAPSSTSELRREFVSGSTKDSSARMPSTENSSSGSVGSLFSRAGASVPQLHIQISSHSSAPSSGNSSMGHGGDS